MSSKVEVIDPVELLLNPGPKQRKKKVITEWYDGCTTCKQCSKTFATKYALDVHTRTHTGEKPYQCKLCLKTFTQKAHIKRHALVHTSSGSTVPAQEKTFTCEECSSTFKDSRAFKRHKNLHFGFDLRYICEVCNKSYARLSSLNQHKISHDSGYPCKSCSEVFATFPELRTHKAQVHKKPPLHCDQCNKDFFHQSDLKIHNRKHSGARPFTCEVCNKAFKSVSHVNRHIKTHKDYTPAPYSRYPPCFKCHMPMNTQIQVLTHKCDTDDPLFPYTCAECGNGYVEKFELRRHMRDHFPEKVKTT